MGAHEDRSTYGNSRAASRQLTDKLKRYLLASDNASDFAQRNIELLESKALQDIDDLFMSEQNRDAELWAELGVPEELVIDDYEAEHQDNRDLDWSTGVAGIAAASTVQFFLDNRVKTLIEPLAYRDQVLAPFEMTQAELVIVGKRQVEVVAVETYQKLKASFMADLSFLDDIPNKELFRILDQANAMRSIEKQIADISGYVARVTDVPPGSPRFIEEVNWLIDRSSERNLQAMNRRAVEQLHSFRESDGDPNTLMVWLVEFSPSTCGPCLENAGEVHTYDEWQDLGTPGAAVCMGGDSCRCHLSAV